MLTCRELVAGENREKTLQMQKPGEILLPRDPVWVLGQLQEEKREKEEKKN